MWGTNEIVAQRLDQVLAYDHGWGHHFFASSVSAQTSKNQNELQRLVRQRLKAVLLVEPCCLGVFGVYEQCMDTDMLKDQPGALDCIQQQQLSQTLPLSGAVYRQSSKPNARDSPRKPLGQFVRKLLGQDLASRERVEP